MAHSLDNIRGRNVVLGLSGGVDSAVAAVLLLDAGARVQALHMTNWEDDDGYCTAASDLQDARRVCDQLGIPLHHVNFATQYRERVFAHFLDEYRKGRTPNPDVLCNREIKFGEFREHARRLGGELLATGHYARTSSADGRTCLLKGVDPGKDQSYFLHAVSEEALAATVFPLGDLTKDAVRRTAHHHGLALHDKKDSTGICFIGERPFRDFLAGYLPAQPGPIRTPDGRDIGEHQGLMFYTLGQRQGLDIGGRAGAREAPWYVVGKDTDANVLLVDQADDQGRLPMLDSDVLRASAVSWIGGPPPGLGPGAKLMARVRYRQADQACTVIATGDGDLDVCFDEPQRAVAPGQFVVFYSGERCLGGATIDRAWQGKPGAKHRFPAADGLHGKSASAKMLRGTSQHSL